MNLGSIKNRIFGHKAGYQKVNDDVAAPKEKRSFGRSLSNKVKAFKIAKRRGKDEPIPLSITERYFANSSTPRDSSSPRSFGQIIGWNPDASEMGGGIEGFEPEDESLSDSSEWQQRSGFGLTRDLRGASDAPKSATKSLRANHDDSAPVAAYVHPWDPGVRSFAAPEQAKKIRKQNKLINAGDGGHVAENVCAELLKLNSLTEQREFLKNALRENRGNPTIVAKIFNQLARQSAKNGNSLNGLLADPQMQTDLVGGFKNCWDHPAGKLPREREMLNRFALYASSQPELQDLAVQLNAVRFRED